MGYQVKMKPTLELIKLVNICLMYHYITEDFVPSSNFQIFFILTRKCEKHNEIVIIRKDDDNNCVLIEQKIVYQLLS